MKLFQKITKLFISASLLASMLLVGGISSAAARTDSGQVYILSNAADGNAVMAFNRMSNGSLEPAGSFDTGGLGTGAGLGSQGALVMSNYARLLFVVNAGSNDISSFIISRSGLALADTEPSGGVMPISLTTHGNLVYVLNAGDGGNISGFQFDSLGNLTPMAGSTQTLSNGGVGDAPGPAQISFAPDGGQLIVTEKATNLIDTYKINSAGLPGPVVTHPSAGVTPFGFAFSQSKVMIVSEAVGGGANASTASSYNVSRGSLDVISPAIPSTQTAACWVAVSKDGSYAYTTNTGSGSVSSYQVDESGNLTLLEAQAGLTGDGSGPIDMAFSGNRYLYTLNAGTDAISAFRMHPDGSLTAINGMDGLPDGAVGMAAR